MKRVALFALCVVLVGCGGAVRTPAPTPAPAPAPAPIDIARFLFHTNGRNVGPAHVFDNWLEASQLGVIARATYTPAAANETHSVYDALVACIRVLREEAWDRPPLHLFNVQTYTASPCWINARTILPGQSIRTEIHESPWTWQRFDGGPGGQGVFNERTLLTASADGQMLTLLDSYDDPDRPEFPPYCTQGVYDAQGLRSLTALAPSVCAETFNLKIEVKP